MVNRACNDRRVERYDEIGQSYGRTRRADPRIATQITAAIGAAATVVNVGAGTGNYEPDDRLVVAVEPSPTMIAQRPAGAAPAVRARAEALPFATTQFDVATAFLTVHHWHSLDAGIREMRRVARRQVVWMFEPVKDADFWLVADYVPIWLELDKTVPTLADLAARLDVRTVEVVRVPSDCVDGFGGAFWNRPEMYLNPDVQAGISSLARLEPAVLADAMQRLRTDLASGTWDRRHGHLRHRAEIDLGYRLIIAGS